MTDNFHNEKCDASVKESFTLPECSNEAFKPYGNYGPVVAKIPVVIAEPVIQIDVESVIDLDEPALEIKRIKKNLYLTQSKLVPTDSPKYGKLFLSGFIRKNIEFATVESACSKKSAICGDIRHATVNVPFKCVTKVYFENQPEFGQSGFSKEIEFFTDKIKTCDACSQKVIGKDPCEQDFVNFEFFSEKVFTELVDVKFFEEDIHMNPSSLGYEFPVEHCFESFTEKIVVFVKLKLLQNQQIFIPKPTMKKSCKDFKEKWDW